MTGKAVEETIRICLDKDVLAEYLAKKKTEVVTIMMRLFDAEYYEDLYRKDIAKKAARQATMDTARDTAERLIKKGQMTLENIADCVPSLSMDELKKIAAKVVQ